MLSNATGSPPVFEEWVWNDSVGATGGGSSAIFPIPPYQLAAGITGIKDSSDELHTNRFIPGISGMNEMTGFFIGGNPIPKIYGTATCTCPIGLAIDCYLD